MLRELASVGGMQLPPSPPTSNKRGRGAYGQASQTSPPPLGLPDTSAPTSIASFPPEQQVPTDAPRTIAGSRRAKRASPQERHGQHPQHRQHEFEPTPPRLPVYNTELGQAPLSVSPPFFSDTSSIYWFQGGSKPLSSSVGGSTVRREQTFGGDMGLSRGGAGVLPAYPVVSNVVEYEQTIAAGMGMGGYAPSGGAHAELYGHAYSSMQNHSAIAPSSSSSYHSGAEFFCSPGFGDRGVAPAPFGGVYGGGGMLGLGGMDAGLHALTNNDSYGMWLNAS